MLIKNHLLYIDPNQPVPYKPAAHIGVNIVRYKYIILHYTEGQSAVNAWNWLIKKVNGDVSAHIVIGRDAKIYQAVPFNRIAWHAGKSKWGSDQDLNRLSIGIELDNAGRFTKKEGQWTATFKKSYPESDVFVGSHHNERIKVSGWHKYTDLQIQAAIEVCKLLAQEYHFEMILGHDDIAPGRKTDPGPAFPMEAFRMAVGLTSTQDLPTPIKPLSTDNKGDKDHSRPEDKLPSDGTHR